MVTYGSYMPARTSLPATAVGTALGLEPRPPHPDGDELAPGDLGLLADVRKSGKLYRDV